MPLTDIGTTEPIYRPISKLVSSMHISRDIGISATTDTDISVLPILAISADTDMPTLIFTKSEGNLQNTTQSYNPIYNENV